MESSAEWEITSVYFLERPISQKISAPRWCRVWKPSADFRHSLCSTGCVTIGRAPGTPGFSRSEQKPRIRGIWFNCFSWDMLICYVFGHPAIHPPILFVDLLAGISLLLRPPIVMEPDKKSSIRWGYSGGRSSMNWKFHAMFDQQRLTENSTVNSGSMAYL